MAAILYADDDPSWRKLMKRGLERGGHIVHAFSNGAEALEALEDGVGYDIVVTDGRMPQMDGLQLLEAIRLSSAFKNLPVIVLTGEDQWEGEVAKRGGIYLFKGVMFGSDVLRKVVEQTLAAA